MTGPAFLRSAAPSDDPAPRDASIRCQSFGQVAGPAAWRMALLHDRPDDLLLWVTRGQGRVVINGVRRGLGVNNAVFVPAGTLMAVELGPQSLAQVIESPAQLTDLLPTEPLHLRPRDSLAQAELTAEVEAMQREVAHGRALAQEALGAHLLLIAVWLERQRAVGTVDAPRDDATERLVRRYARLLVRHFDTGRTAEDYAELLDVDLEELDRATLAACGRSPEAMLAERLLHAVRGMLAQEAPDLAGIVAALGFDDAERFARFVETEAGAKLRPPESAPKAALLRGPGA